VPSPLSASGGRSRARRREAPSVTPRSLGGGAFGRGGCAAYGRRRARPTGSEMTVGSEGSECRQEVEPAGGAHWRFWRSACAGLRQVGDGKGSGARRPSRRRLPAWVDPRDERRRPTSARGGESRRAYLARRGPVAMTDVILSRVTLRSGEMKAPVSDGRRRSSPRHRLIPRNPPRLLGDARQGRAVWSMGSKSLRSGARVGRARQETHDPRRQVVEVRHPRSLSGVE